MNDPKDILVSINQNKKLKDDQEQNTEIKIEITLTEEERFQNLIYHLNKNLTKKLYKKTIKEIDTLLQKNIFDSFTQFWKLSILKIRANLRIIKRKIFKYFFIYNDKSKFKHNINNVKKYINSAQEELVKLVESKIDFIANNQEMLDSIIFCYFEYIYYVSLFHKKLGNFMEALSLLSLSITLYKQTILSVTSIRTFFYIEKCFLSLIQIFIANEDYDSSMEYLDLVIQICFKHLIFYIHDIYEGVIINDNKNNTYGTTSNNDISNTKKSRDKKNTSGNINNITNSENEKTEEVGDLVLKKILNNMIIVFLYKGICYENIGKIVCAIRCYGQCNWFLNKFFNGCNTSMTKLIYNINKKSREFKNSLNFLEKKINFYENQSKKNQNMGKFKPKLGVNTNKNSVDEFFYNTKFSKLINKLNNLKIIEIDTVNKFEMKKNIRCLSSRKREGRDKNIFLSGIRLLDTYLRDDFRDIIDHMDKIKSFDLDYSIREKIQKFLYRKYFEQSQKKNNSQKELSHFPNKNNKKSNDYHDKKYEDNNLSSINNNCKNNQATKSHNPTDNDDDNNIKINNDVIKIENQRYNNYNNSSKSLNKLSRSQSAILLTKNNNKNNKRHNINEKANKTIDFSNIIENKNNSLIKDQKKYFWRNCHNLKLSSFSPIHKIEIDDKKLNKFFNKKYLAKRKYIKKLEDRELLFQKSILKLKNTPKIQMPIHNKQVIKQLAEQSFNKIQTLLISNPINWRENFSEEEIKNLVEKVKLENRLIRSLDKKALADYKTFQEKEKIKNNVHEDINIQKKNVNKNNQMIINSINGKIDALKEREMIEEKNYRKLLMRNREYLKYRANKYNSPDNSVKKTNNQLYMKFREGSKSPKKIKKNISASDINYKNKNTNQKSRNFSGSYSKNSNFNSNIKNKYPLISL